VLKWFGVQTFYRTRVVGPPSGRDHDYVPGLASVEERIVLFRARNGQSALRKALREAKSYCAGFAYKNVYDQQVITEFIEYAEAYEIDDDPADGTEVFSRIETIGSRETSASVLKRKLGREAGLDTARMFIAGFITEALDEHTRRS
jgi:hypothetical protein